MITLKNIGNIIFLIINTILIASFVSFLPITNNSDWNYYIAIVLYIISGLISLSPVGEIYLRFKFGCKKLTPELEERLLPIFNEVYEKAKLKDNSLPDDIQLFICDENLPNAFATGRKTICVTKGLLYMPDDCIKGIFGHELGHISNKDTYLLQFIILGNFAINIIIAVFSAINWIILAISTSDKKGELGFLAFFALIPTIMILILSLWTRIGVYLVMWSSRSQEYHADQFSKELGYSEHLKDALYLLDDYTDRSRSIFAALSSSHPKTDYRIKRLEEVEVA